VGITDIPEAAPSERFGRIGAKATLSALDPHKIFSINNLTICIERYTVRAFPHT